MTVTDGSGNPKSGVSVTFALGTVPGGAAGQSLSTTTTTTDISGQASSTLTLGSKAGSYTVTATSGTLVGSPVTFHATGLAGTATQVGVETAPDGSGTVVGTQNISSGNSITVYAITRDALGELCGQPEFDLGVDGHVGRGDRHGLVAHVRGEFDLHGPRDGQWDDSCG